MVKKRSYEHDIVLSESDETISPNPLKIVGAHLNALDYISYVGFDASGGGFAFDFTVVSGFVNIKKGSAKYVGFSFPTRAIPGYSGSPILNLKGEVIAILFAIAPSKKFPKPYLHEGEGAYIEKSFQN